MRKFSLPLKLAAVMRDFEPDWLVAGGWAIDLYLGKITRPHQDIEIAVFRKDQIPLQSYLDGWLLKKVTGGEFSVWGSGEQLSETVFEIHCFNEAKDPPQFEILLNKSNETEWVFRRDEKVKRALDKCRMLSKAGVKILSPEIVLLYKSKNPRDKDIRDFEAVIGRLAAERKEWLRNALATTDAGHPWLRMIN